ncbi:MAG: hypothetical protein QXS02_04785, partial [Candidatus Thermoplasmatota archaeon]
MKECNFKETYSIGDVNRLRIDDTKLIIRLHVDPTRYNSHEELYNAVYEWWINIRRGSPSTIKNILRHARNMQNHPIYPVDWLLFQPEQILNHLLYRQVYEYQEKKRLTGNPNYGATQLRNFWKTVKIFSEAFGIDVGYWGWRPPLEPTPQVRIIPRPPIVSKIIHHQYSKDKIKNSLIKTMLTVGFYTGMRPCEL